MKHVLRIAAIVVFGGLILSCSSGSEISISPAVEEAVLRGDWETVFDSITIDTAGVPFEPIAFFKQSIRRAWAFTLSRPWHNPVHCRLKGYACLYRGRPEDAAVWHSMIEMETELTLWAQWIDSLKQQHPRNPAVLHLAGDWESESDRSDEAIRTLSAALAIEPDCLLYISRGNAYWKKQDIEHAFADYDQAIIKNPYSAPAYYQRAKAHQLMKTRDRAEDDYTRAIQLDPRMTAALVDRGTLFAELQIFDDAINDYNRALDINPRLYRIYLERGLARHHLGEYRQAIEEYTEAITKNTENALAHLLRGATYRENNMYDSARADFDRAIDLDPNCGPARILGKLIPGGDVQPGSDTTQQPYQIPSHIGLWENIIFETRHDLRGEIYIFKKIDQM